MGFVAACEVFHWSDFNRGPIVPPGEGAPGAPVSGAGAVPSAPGAVIQAPVPAGNNAEGRRRLQSSEGSSTTSEAPANSCALHSSICTIVLSVVKWQSRCEIHMTQWSQINSSATMDDVLWMGQLRARGPTRLHPPKSGPDILNYLRAVQVNESFLCLRGIHHQRA